MKRIFSLLIIALISALSVDAQIYQTIPGYGFKWQRVSPDSVLHLPSSADTSLRTSYTTRPQIRAVGDSVWYYTGSSWRNLSRGGVDTSAILSQVVRTFGTQSVNGSKTFLDSILFNKTFAAFNSLAIFGTGAATVRIGYGANTGESLIKLGDSFLFKRNGTAEPIIQSVGRGMLIYSHGLSVYGDSISGTYAPGKLRLAGNFSLGVAHFGAYNSATSVLYFGNESTTSSVYTNEMTVYGRNNRWMINDTSTLPTYQASAIFTLQSTKKGFLLPRMTTTQRDAISSPATGLEVYNTTTNRQNFYNGSQWVESFTTLGGTLTGDLSITTLPTSTIPYIGTSGRLVGNINKLSFDTTQGFLAVNTGTPLSNIDARGSSSTTDAITFNGNRSVSSMNTNTTDGNVTEFSLRTVNTSSIAYTGVALQAINNSHTAGGENSGFSLKTITSGTFAERLYIEGTTFRVSAFAGGGTAFIRTDNSGNLTAIANPFSTLTLGRGLTGTSYNTTSAVTARLDTTGRYTWTRSQQFLDSIKGVDFEGFNYWAVYPDGGGYFSASAFSWSATGNVTMRNLSANTITAANTGTPLVSNSTNSNNYKLSMQDNATLRGLIGANASNALIVANSAEIILATINSSTGKAVFSLTSGNNGEIIEMSRSAGSYAWKIGIDAASSNFNFYNNGGTSVANINNSTGAYTATSDSSAKKNIVDAGPALEIISQIKVSAYDWKDSNLHEPFGVIAQQLYGVVPMYVSRPGIEGGRWGVQKAEMVPMLIKGIQEINQKTTQEIEALKTEINTLKAEINLLKNK